jgi:hypothetical protein
VSPVKYELGFYIPEDDILHSNRRENVKSYTEIVDFIVRNKICRRGLWDYDMPIGVPTEVRTAATEVVSEQRRLSVDARRIRTQCGSTDWP